MIEEGIGDVDLQDVVDLGPIGGQGDDLEHFDIEDIGGFDMVNRQGDVIFFAGRHLAGRQGRFEQVVMEVDGLAAHQGDGRGGQHGPNPKDRINSRAMVMALHYSAKFAKSLCLFWEDMQDLTPIRRFDGSLQ